MFLLLYLANSSRLFVGNIPKSVTPDQLKGIFPSSIDIRIPRNDDGTVKGLVLLLPLPFSFFRFFHPFPAFYKLYAPNALLCSFAFVEFLSPTEVGFAIGRNNGVTLEGRMLVLRPEEAVTDKRVSGQHKHMTCLSTNDLIYSTIML